jgi:hypothetical protein
MDFDGVRGFATRTGSIRLPAQHPRLERFDISEDDVWVAVAVCQQVDRNRRRPHRVDSTTDPLRPSAKGDCPCSIRNGRMHDTELAGIVESPVDLSPPGVVRLGNTSPASPTIRARMRATMHWWAPRSKTRAPPRSPRERSSSNSGSGSSRVSTKRLRGVAGISRDA